MDFLDRDYNPKAPAPPPQAPPSQQFLISPITGEKIPADKIEEHMRYGQWEEREGGRERGREGGRKVREAGMFLSARIEWHIVF